MRSGIRCEPRLPVMAIRLTSRTPLAADFSFSAAARLLLSPPPSAASMESAHKMKRDLANALVAAGAHGIAGYVQECVHSTTLGVDATFVFLMQLIDELDDALAQFLPANASAQELAEPLAEADEVELGSLLSAASLAVRYVTEKKAMLPLLERYRAAFASVLFYPSWQRKCYFGLKAVALMGSTRVLEAFGEHVAVEDVEKRLRWLFSLFLGDTTPATDAAQRLNCLLRPACEYVTVAMQTHPVARRTISNEVLPLLMRLLMKEGAAEVSETSALPVGSTATPGVAEPVKVELAATIAILLEAKFPQTPLNPFSLLKLPAFVEEMEPLDASTSIGVGALDDDEPNAEDDKRNADDSEEKSVVPLTLEQEIECTKVLSSWLRVPERRLIAAQTLPILYRVIMETASRVEMTIGMPSGAFPMEDLVQSLKEVPMESLLDFEFTHAIIEAMRDIMLSAYRVPSAVLETAFWELESVMPRLETSLGSGNIPAKELRAVKSLCSRIRHALVEAFLSWLHHHNSRKLLSLMAHFVQNVAGTLADPRVYGDALAVLRVCKHPDAPEKYKACLQLTVVTMSRALDQIDRYSKNSANRIICGLTRIAAACDRDLLQVADDLVGPLLPCILDGSQWGKFLRLRTEAVAAVLLGCAGDERFQLDDHPWVKDFIAVLLDPVVSSENAHSLMILNVLVRAHDKLLHRVVSFCLNQPHTVTQRLHEPLHRWPIYEEDVELVVVTLELLKSLLTVEALRSSLDRDVIFATILQLAENAEGDKLDAVSSACRDILANSLS